MKNQYLADAGDYGKYGLLRFLAGRGIRISVNWYLTPNDLVPVDGNKRKYLEENAQDQPDPELFEAMKRLSRNNFPSVRDIEKAELIPGADYFTPEVDRDQREKWFSLNMSIPTRSPASVRLTKTLSVTATGAGGATRTGRCSNPLSITVLRGSGSSA